VIHHRFEGIKLRRRLVAPTIAAAAIAVAAFAERLAALAAPRSAIPIAVFAVARLAVAWLAFAPLLIIAPRSVATLTIAVAPIAPALIAIAAPLGAAVTALLLRTLARWDHCDLSTVSRRAFRPRATPTAPASAWAIAPRQCRESELPAGSNRFDPDAARRRLHGGFIAWSRSSRRRFIRRARQRRCLRRSAFGLRSMPTPATTATTAMRIAGKMEGARRLASWRCLGR